MKKRGEYLASEVAFVFKNGVEISVHANAVGEHLLLVVEESIGAEVISVVDVFGDRGAATTTCDSVRGGSHVHSLSALFNF